MNQSQTIDLQVKVSLQLKEQQEPIIKRIQTVQTYNELLAACKQVCDKSGVQDCKNLKISYRDSDNDKIEVQDDMELQMAYATALSTDCKVKFNIELASYLYKQPPVVVEEPKQQPEVVAQVQAEPEVVKQQVEEKQEVQEMLPEHVSTLMQQPVIEAELDLYNENVIDDDAERPCHGKGKKGKGKKGKGKHRGEGHGAGMPRKAIKNLIRAELEKEVPGIFDKLVKEVEQEQQQQPIVEEEESKDQSLVAHEGIECDNCGVCPIMGIRYKCAVRKDYDLCAKCEATIPSDYPFLKIRKNGGAPSMIITVLNEDKDGKPLGEGQQPDWSQMKEAWKNAKKEWKENGGCKDKKEWNKEDCHGKMKFWKHMVGGFLDKMGIDKDLAKEQWKQAKQDWKEQHGGNHGHHGWKHCGGGNKDGYKVKRAEVVSNPDVVLECQPGCVVLHDIEVRNNTHWGWKQGIVLSLDSTVEQSDLPFELINIPVDQKVEAMSNLKMTVPITVLEKAAPADEVKEYKLRFRGPKGGEIGEPITFKLKIVGGTAKAAEQPKVEQPKKSHLELVKLAVKLFDTDKLGQTFNECLEVVTLVNGDEEVAKKSLQPRQ